MKRNGKSLRRNDSQQARRAQRTWFRVGPGLLLAVMASVFVWMRVPRQPGPPPGGPPQTLPAQTTASRPSAPDPEWVLKNAERLKLTPAQTVTMRRLDGRWEKETRELRAELKAASTDFDGAMAASGSKGLPLADVQRLAVPVSDLTRQLAAARRAWWDEASTHLSSAQRKSAEKAWSSRFEPRGTGQPATRADLNDESKVKG